MGIINFDYKIKAGLVPVITQTFEYEIYMDVEYSASRQSELAYEGVGRVDTMSDSVASSRRQTDETVADLCRTVYEGLFASHPETIFHGYILRSRDPQVQIMCLTVDGSTSPIAWSHDLSRSVVEVETDWIHGPQINDEIVKDSSTRIPLHEGSIEDILIRNTTTPLPQESIITYVHVSLSDARIVAEHEDRIYAYSIEGVQEAIREFKADAGSVDVVRGMTALLTLQIVTSLPEGVRPDLIAWSLDSSIATAEMTGDNNLLIKGVAQGSTELQVTYNGNNLSPISITVSRPKGKVEIIRDKERSFIGDENTLHIKASYENGEPFTVNATNLEIVSGTATVEKMDDLTYKVTPGAHEILELSLSVDGAYDDINATIKISTWKKQLIRFHTLPEKIAVLVNEEATIEAFYQPLYEEMIHDDEDIFWEIVEGADLVQITSHFGKGTGVRALKKGRVVLRAEVYGDYCDTVIEVAGETERVLRLIPDNMRIAPGDVKTIYAQVLNGDAPNVSWSVPDSGIVRIVKQSETFVQIEGIVNGTVSLTGRDGDLTQQAAIEVNEMMIQSFQPMAADVDSGWVHEDTGEQWTDSKYENNYVDGKGFSTLLYAKASGVAEELPAFHSGIGDQDDLMVKKPDGENVVMPFKYAARMSGKKRHSIMIYPEIKFQYSIQVRGDLYLTYNESRFKVGIDAYPAKAFQYQITEEAKLAKDRPYELKMDIQGDIPQKTLEYAVNWNASIEINDMGDAKNLFTSSAGTYVGSGTTDVWKLGGGGFVYETANRGLFSGVVMASGAMDWTHYEAEFDFKPIHASNDVNAMRKVNGVWVNEPGADDDIVGLIFKAKSNTDFYVMLWEGDERIKGSWRAGDNLDGFNIATDGESAWANRVVKSSPTYTGSDSMWNLYETGTGWKDQHRRIYKVSNGVMTRVNVVEQQGGNGWRLDGMHSMRVRSMGTHTEIAIKHPDEIYEPNAAWYPVFTFETEWDTGSFGMATISQAVEFHGIRVRRWGELTGRVPETGWDTFAGSGTQAISPKGSDYVTPNVTSKLDIPDRSYVINSVTCELKDNTAGRIDGSKDTKIMITNFNPPNAGQSIKTTFRKTGIFSVTPDHISQAAAGVAVDDVRTLFKQEITKFKSDNPSLASVDPTFTLIEPIGGENDFNGSKLLMWNSAPEIVTTVKDFTTKVKAYEGWLTATDLKGFLGGNWSKYTIVFTDNVGTINPAFDAWKWQISGMANEHTKPNDVLLVKTTEWYRGAFPADIEAEGTVTSEAIVYVDIPPNHEHYVDPYSGAPMPAIFAEVDYLLHKFPIGKQSFTWMYWEGTPNVTTRNAADQGAQVNVINQELVIKTNRQNDRVAIICDIDPRYMPWSSGKYIGYGKVNGQRPFFGEGAGKAGLIDVPTDVVFIPETLMNIQPPIIEVNHKDVNFYYDAFKKTANFSSEFKDAYIWFTDWHTDWVQDTRGFHADLEGVTVIPDTVAINPMSQSNYDDSVMMDSMKIEVITDNPFVSAWVEDEQGADTGLLGEYYQYPQETTVSREGFIVTGNYQLKEQVFQVEQAIVGSQTDGKPFKEGFFLGTTPKRGVMDPLQFNTVHTVYVPANTPKLAVAASFMIETGNHYPDMMVIAPNNESFGIRYNNGTWAEAPIDTTKFADESDITSANRYRYSGDISIEQMIFDQPKEGSWKILVYNQGLTAADYAITTNMSISPQQSVDLMYAPDPWNLVVKVNGSLVAGTNYTLAGKMLTLTSATLVGDYVEVIGTAGGQKIANLPMQSEFEMQDEPPFNIASVSKNDVNIPMSSMNGYTMEGKTFKLHGSYLTPGIYHVRYATGELDAEYTLKTQIGQGVAVYLNGVKLDSTKYTVSGNKVTVDQSLLRSKDWIHVQSYVVVGEFDPSKKNYLGQFAFSRIDPQINFNWSYYSPFTDPQAPAAAMFQSMDVIADTVKFGYNLDMDISYPDNQPIDVTNFTGTWSKFDENIGADVGDWHGPPEVGYDKVTNLYNTSYRSGWYNPLHVNFDNYSFKFKVQEVDSGDDDMYGALFRFDPDTLNYYSFEMDAYLSRSGVGGTGVNGMAIYRNTCTNPSQYGTARLTYNKVQLAHLPQGWTYAAKEINEIRVQLVGRNIRVYVNGNQKFDYTDESPDAILRGAWGPLTQSQPQTFFWDFQASKMKLASYVQDGGFRHAISSTATRPTGDGIKLSEVETHAKAMSEEFAADVSRFITGHPGLTQTDLSINYKISSDTSDHRTFFSNDHTVRVLELQPDILKLTVPSPDGKTSIQHAVERFGNFSPYEKIQVTTDWYANYASYSANDFDVLTFTAADCNAQADFLDANMAEFVREFKRLDKVIIFTHDMGYTSSKPIIRGLLAEFGFTVDSNLPSSGTSDVIKPKQIEPWMMYPYDMSQEMQVTPAHTTHVTGGTEYYMFSATPTYAWLKGVGNVFYSEAGHATITCAGDFVQYLSDNEMKIWINLMMKVATWRNDTNRKTSTLNKDAKVYASVTIKPLTAPTRPDWMDYREINQDYYDPDMPMDVYAPNKPEPYVPDLEIPADDNPSDGFSITWKGHIFAPTTGTYKFFATSDDGFRLKINGQSVIEEWHNNPGSTFTGFIELQGGKWHDLYASYYENAGAAQVKLDWQTPDSNRQTVPNRNLTPYLGYQVNARVREQTPLPWHPMIHNGYYYFEEKEHALYAGKIRLVKTPVDHQILIKPRPQQGAAIIVRDNEGNNLRKTSFYQEFFNEEGSLASVEPTLYYTDRMAGNGLAKYYLAYRDIDPNTLSVILNGVTISTDNYLFDPETSSVSFLNELGITDEIVFRYVPMYSYYIDMNHDVAGDVARIVLHSSYDIKRMTDMEIIYEGAIDTPFYRADEVSFNPILNHNHRGFLYITNKLDESVKSVEIHVSPKTLPANGVNRALVTAKVNDRNGNPVQNKNVFIYRDGVQVKELITNRAGEVYFYDQPQPGTGLMTKYQAMCDDLTHIALLNFYKPDVASRFFVDMRTNKASVLAGKSDTATVTITLRDENWTIVKNQVIQVSIKDTMGVLQNLSLTTNESGQAQVTISGLKEVAGAVAIEASYQFGAEGISNFIFLKVIGA